MTSLRPQQVAALPAGHTMCWVRSDATRRGRRGYIARRARRDTSPEHAQPYFVSWRQLPLGGRNKLRPSRQDTSCVRCVRTPRAEGGAGTSRAGPVGTRRPTPHSPTLSLGGRCSPVATAVPRRPQQVAALPHATPRITSPPLSIFRPRRRCLVHASSVKRRGGGRGWAVFEHMPQACERNRTTPSLHPGASPYESRTGQKSLRRGYHVMRVGTPAACRASLIWAIV